MKLDQAINSFVANTIAALQMAGTVAGARVHVDGGQAQAYAAGWDDALVSLARALGVADAPQLPAPIAQIAPTLKTGNGLPLTPREMEVAILIAAGDSSREIARTLVMEVGTVKTHRRNLMDKIGGTDRAHVAAWLKQHPA